MALPARDEGINAGAAACQMISHWLTVFGAPTATYSDNGGHFTGAWFRTMYRLIGVQHPSTVAYHSRSNRRAKVAGFQIFEQLKEPHP